MQEDARALLAHPSVQRADAYIRDTDARTVADQIGLAEIPAPPFSEGPRGDRVAELLRDAGLDGVERDDRGNVLAGVDGPAQAPLILSAHLDTVFPAGTDVSVTRSGGRLVGAGISDDARGLAALITVARALRHADLTPACPLLFVATVGEEGEGDLRGVRHLFRDGGPAAGAQGFVSLDGAGMRRIVSRALGSRRLRFTIRGPGGHSWVDWGAPNPIFAMADAVETVSRMPLSSDPLATATAARWGGGHSINAIPEAAWVELDLRSESVAALEDTEARVRQAMEAAVRRASGRAEGTGARLGLSVEVIGDRPAGRTPPEAPLVLSAVGATRALGSEPELIASSTDSNVPMFLGVPAITIGAGGRAGRAHSTEEWYENAGGPDGIVRALLTTLLVTGLANGG